MRTRAAHRTSQPTSRQLARYGIVGITDTSASNTTDTLADFQRLSDGGELLQHFSMMGSDELDRGYLKILLDEDRPQIWRIWLAESIGLDARAAI